MKKTSLIFLVLMISVVLVSWAFAADEGAKWTPQYGEKGELLNPEPSVIPFGRVVDNQDYPVPFIDTQILFEDFNNWGPQGDNPPTGWTITDNGDEDPAVWNDNDWYKYYSSSWGDTVAKINYSPIENQDEWLISPAMDFSARTSYDQIFLKFNQYYNDGYGDTDTGFVMVYNGTDWIAVDTFLADIGSYSTPNAYEKDITSAANNNAGVQVAFKYVGNNDYYWYVDKVEVVGVTLLADDVAKTAINAPTMAIEGYNWNIQTTVNNLGTNAATFDDSTYIYEIVKTQYLFEDFEGDWGEFGDNPPTGWTIYDYGDEDPAVWNSNDWYKYYYTSTYGNVACVRYTPAEHSNEWLITPAIDLSTVSENIYMGFHTYYNWYSSDTAYVLGTTDDFTTIDTLAEWMTDHTNEFPVWDITSWAANQSAVKIAFVYHANDDMLWYVNDVEIFSLSYPPATYVSGESITGLTSLADTLISYTNTWNSPDASEYIITSFTAMASDLDNSNDTTSVQITCYPHTGSGGPDAGYYSWEDNITGTGGAYGWIDISTSGTPVTWDGGSSDDRYTYGIAMGFDFDFYGGTFNRIFVDENGFATFDSITTSGYSNYRIPTTSGSENQIALLWDDLSGVDEGTAYYYTNNVDTFIISYENWDFETDHAQRIDMQMILCGADNSVKFQYQEVGPVIYTSHTIGIENGAGDIGLCYEYNNDPIGSIAMPGLAISYSYDPPQIDGALTSIDVPLDDAVLVVGESVTPTVTISSLGDDPITPSVTFKIFDELADEVYTATETTSEIAGHGSLQFAFSTDFTVPSEGDFDVLAYVEITGDINNANDTAASVFEAYTHYSTGGPDGWGYRFIDNISVGTALDLPAPPTFNYIDITSTGTFADDGSGNYGLFPIGFSFEFYDQVYMNMYINGYGYLTFGDYTSSSTNDCPLPSTSSPYDPLIAGFWDYGYCNASYEGAVYYQTFGTSPDMYTVIQFHNYRRSSTNLEWEIILYESGDILLQYLDIDEAGSYGAGQSATVGIQSIDNLVPDRAGLSYVCNGDPDGNLLRDSLAVLYYYYEPAIDPIMVSVDAPAVGEVGTATYPSVTVKNNGTIETTIDVTVKIVNPSGDTVYSATETTPSMVYETVQSYTFATGWTPAVSGVHTILASVYVDGDEFPENNNAQGSATIFGSVFDFESGNGGLKATAGDWQYGTPSGEGPGGAHSGDFCWGTVLNGLPNESTISNLDFMLDVTPALPFALDEEVLLTEGFENGGSIPTGWTDSPGDDPWLYDDGTDHGPDAPHSGSYAAFYNNYDYSSGTTDTLISPSMDFSAYSGSYTVGYWGWCNETGPDSMVVYLYEDGALTRLGKMLLVSEWTYFSYDFNSSATDGKIYFIGYSNYGFKSSYIDDVEVAERALPTADFHFYEWYDGSTMSYYYRVLADSGNGYELLDQWQGRDEEWKLHTVNLSAYSGVVKMRMQMETGTYISGYPGWYVDDFAFDNCEFYYYSDEVEVVSIDSPDAIIDGDAIYDITATVRNNGISTVSFDVKAEDNHGWPAPLRTVTDLAPDATAQVTFPCWWALACSSYTVSVTTLLPGDQDPSNDTSSKDFETIPPYNTFATYDDGIVNSAWRFTIADYVIANEFVVPFENVPLSAITYDFYKTWPDDVRDSVRVSIFVDGDDDGLPDLTPILTDTLVVADVGPTLWAIDCENDITLNCETFWAGYAQINDDNSEAISIDDGNDYGKGWAMQYDGVGMVWYWSQYDPFDGDNMIRAYYTADSSTAPIMALSPESVSGSANVGGADADVGALENTNITGCDLEYTVSVMQTVGTLALNNNLRGEPMAWVEETYKAVDQGIVQSNIENKKMTPVYPPMTLGAGGPDAFGYSWTDSDESGGPTYGWVDISTIGTEISWYYGTVDDGYTDPIPMGMNFSFYGADYNSLVVGTNGWASFVAQSNAHYGDDPIPDSDDPNALLAVYWDDMDGGSVGHCYYYHDATENQFIVSWVGWPHYPDPNDPVDFQIILDADDGTVLYQYGTGTFDNDNTTGIEDENGAVGLEVCHNQTYITNSLAVLIEPPPVWLTTDLVDGSLAPGTVLEIEDFNIFMDASKLDCGVYNGAIVVSSNDPVNPVAQMDVDFTVGSTLNGVVTDAGDEPIENVVVNLYDVNILMTEGFESGALPTGWTDSPGTDYPWLYGDGTQRGPGAPHTGDYAAYYDIYNYTYNAEDSLITPSMDYSALGGSYAVSFWYWQGGTSSDSLIVYLSEDGVLTRLGRPTHSESWTQFSYNFSTTTTNGKIYFVGYSRYGFQDLYIDDVMITGGKAIIATDMTNEFGEYEIPCLNSGTYSIDFVLSGYYDAGDIVTISEGSTTTLDMVMHMPAVYSGTVTDFYAAPLGDVHVWAEVPTVVGSFSNGMNSKEDGQSKVPAMSLSMKADGKLDIAGQLFGKDNSRDVGKTQPTPYTGNIKEVYSNGYQPPLADAEYCEIITTNDQYYVGGGWFTGGESYAVFQDPADCELDPTYPYLVTGMKFAMRLDPVATENQWLKYYAIVVDADMTTPTCPVPTDDILYMGALDSTEFAPGDFFWMSSPAAAVVNGPYFMGVYFPDAQTNFQLPLENALSAYCLSYNDYGGGWVDFAAAAWNLNLSNLWRSEGYSTSIDNIVTETWTAGDGTYSLNLTPGNYVIHYDTTGWDSQITDPFAAGLDDVFTNDVVMRRPGSLSGNVTEDAIPLENVHVVVDDGSRAVIGEDYTDEFGDYSIPGIYDGDYTITFALEDYDSIIVASQHINDGEDLVMNQLMEKSGYAYLPGDANMYNGLWKPGFIGADVIYLVGYFTGTETSLPCLLDGFWASADANGDCTILGGDVIRMVQYFRGAEVVIEYCPDYIPLWLTPEDAPETAPDGWPNCDTPPVLMGTKVVPSGSTK
ncbi:MAG: hypothetical protein J7K40_14255 [candidate division Zixibacteria bacterium]|nr:hypothetical protein [candidate division Zixibacteria bacterium]